MHERPAAQLVVAHDCPAVAEPAATHAATGPFASVTTWHVKPAAHVASSRSWQAVPPSEALGARAGRQTGTLTSPPIVGSIPQYIEGSRQLDTPLQQYRRHTPIAVEASVVAADVSTTQSKPAAQSLEARHAAPLAAVPAGEQAGATAEPASVCFGVTRQAAGAATPASAVAA
jgi:hypothetical protein